MFSEEPEDAFIVRIKPAVLKCKTQHALNAWFECSSGELDVILPSLSYSPFNL